MWSRAGIGSTDFSFVGTTLDELLNAAFARYDLRDLTLDANNQFVFRSSVLVNLTSFDVSAQYRDEKRNLSQIYCADIAVEGSP